MTAALPIALLVALFAFTGSRASASSPPSTPKDTKEQRDAAVIAVNEAERRKKKAKKAEPAKKKADASKPAKKKAEAAKPASSTADHAIVVANMQAALNRLGARLVTDGLFGPLTSKAWTDASRARGLDPVIVRVDARNARVNSATARALEAELAKLKPATPAKPQIVSPLPESPRPGPSVAPPSDAPKLPRLPEGYDPSAARREARALATHLKRSGKANYDRRWLERWQRYAGLKPDRLYGGATRGALLHFGGNEAPPPFFPPLETQRYVPPEQRT